MNEFFKGLFGDAGVPKALLAAVFIGFCLLGIATLKKPGGAEENVRIAQAEQSLELRLNGATKECQTAVQFTHRRASLGWPASARMPDGSVMVRQPFTIGKVTHQARCTLRPDGSFEVETEEGFGRGVL
jgi:hypothetical protein